MKNECLRLIGDDEMSTNTDKAKKFFDEPAVECEWKILDEENTHRYFYFEYKTSCGKAFASKMTLGESDFKYCCYCGGKIL